MAAAAERPARRGLLTVAGLALGASALLSACASSQGEASQSSLRDANALAAGRVLAGAAVSAAAWPRADWWKSFGDAQLDALIDEALAGSPTLAVAAARARMALA